MMSPRLTGDIAAHGAHPAFGNLFKILK